MYLSRIFLVTIIFLGLPQIAFAEWHVGYKSISTWNAAENVRLDVGVWYPGRGEERYFNLDEYRLYVAKNTPIHRIIDNNLAGPALAKINIIKKEAKRKNLSKEELNKLIDQVQIPYKKYPVIIISHTSGSSRYSYHTLADLLVKEGYIVAVPMHSQDNAHDMKNFYSAKSIYQRARQCSLTLDLLLSDKGFSSFIDELKISFLGFGSGGTAGLLLAGAELSLDNFQNYCKEYEDDIVSSEPSILLFDVTNKEENVLCKEPMKTQVNNFALSLQKSLEKSQLESFFYMNAVNAKQKLSEFADKILAFQVRWSKRKNPNLVDYIYEPPFVLPYLPPLQTQYTYNDDRIKYYIFVSPGLTMFYKLSGLEKSKAKFMILGLEHDFIHKPHLQAEILAKNLGKKALYLLLSGADLWAMQAPCHGANMLVEICKSVTEDEREVILKRFFTLVSNFIPEFDE